MPTDPEFAADLYRGTARLYDRFRLPYAPKLITSLLRQVRPTGAGAALDLGCGPGQLAFALADSFAEVWAADQEADMIAMVGSKITSSGVRNLRPVVAAAEQLDAPAAHFELVVIGNAFHRMPRQQVAERIASWLRPGSHLALCWSASPWSGDEPWKRVYGDLLADWRDRLGAGDRIPANPDQNRSEHPDAEIIRATGLVPAGRNEIVESYDWTPGTLAGFSYATSFLPITIFGDRTAEFETDLAERLQPHLANGVLSDRVSYAYDLFTRPAPAGT
ncbi:MAG: class I SAM-dependent methyltransferase [Microlunatus sp.]|nr:class I SAM-dependent methyltransferase [Microlunatus sp.]